jgi:hypothetical protein
MTVLLLVAAAALSGAAIAQALTSTPKGVPDARGVFHGCYQLQGRDAGLLRVLPPADPCPNGTTAVSWNAQGQPGPAGPAGPPGTQGPAGVAGGTVYSNSGSIAGGSRAHVSAGCPSGKHALGGGGSFNGGAEIGDAILSSYPSDSGGSSARSGGTASAWTAAAYNSDLASRTFTTWVVCSG